MNNWLLECYWKIPYQKYTGTTLVWTRQLDGYMRMNLQQKSHSVYMRYKHDQGISFDIAGDVILQRQNGWWANPSLESAEAWHFRTGSFREGTVWVDRFSTDAAKFSIIYRPNTIDDHQAQVSIPLWGSPVTPRFQCFAITKQKNCEFPNGQEAGV